MKPNAFIRCSWLLMLTALAAHAQSFALKEGDRVVFYGDSITDQRLYTTLTETYVVTRFPKLNVQFIHSGWGGDRVTGGGGGAIDVRLQRDVFAYQPTVMTIMLGMNDGSYRAFDQAIFDQYSKGYQHIIEAVKNEAPAIRLTLIQPSPYDDVTQPPKFEGGYNSVLVRYGDFLKELAGKEHANLADLNTPVVAALEKAKAANADLAKRIIPDRVHPGPAGHLLMAAALLKSWNAPAIVTAVTIDAARHKIASEKGAKLSGLKFQDGLSWSELDEALPMPVEMNEPVMALAVNSSDFLQTLDQQTLKVAGLADARYTLNIDGKEVGAFTKEQLAEGINLATLATPMVKQAQEVHKLTLEHNNVHFQRWRQIQVPLASEKSATVRKRITELMEAMDEEEAEAVKKQRAAAQPVAHKYELVAK